ncbi:hypothetical protein BS78_05G020700 [Paspalum vaginatum]|nr:hypothetical protein BS78_05G020700 [Paspalum vaginatum]
MIFLLFRYQKTCRFSVFHHMLMMPLDILKTSVPTTSSLAFPFALEKPTHLQFISLLFFHTQAIIIREGESARTDKKMLKKLLPKTKSKKKKEVASSAIPTLDRLHENLEMLEKKERLLQKKCSAEIEKAKDYTKSKNKNAAIQCLKKKKLYETQIEQLSNFQLRVHDQIIMLESAKATTDTVDALRSGSNAVKAIQQSLNIDDIESAIDESNEQTEHMREIQEALATPIGASAEFDEDELEAELEELEDEALEEELPEPPARRPVPVAAKAASSSKQGSSDLSELTKLQAEMAL